MIVRIPVFALLFVACINVSPLQACQPKLNFNFVYDLDDGMHEFAMKYYEEETFDYPVSGVYRKGPARELIWEFHGYLGDSELKDIFSSTGRYFVEAEFRLLGEMYSPDFPVDQSVVLSIYDQGNLVGEFSMGVFIDQQSLRELVARIESSNYVMMCAPAGWGYMEYDKLEDQIRVRSAAKRTVVIDVPTAQILYIDEY